MSTLTTRGSTTGASTTRGSSTGAESPPGWLVVGRSRAVLEVRLFFRDGQQVFWSFLYPTIMMVIFGSVFGDQTVASGVSYPQYFLPGIAATGVMLTSFQALAIDVAVARDQGELARLQATPMPPGAYFVGKAALVLVTATSQLVLLLLVARFGFGVPMPTDLGRWLTFGWVVALSAVAGTALGVAASSLPKSGRSASVVISPIALVLQFFSGVFFVYSELPTWMQQVAALFPLKWMTQGLRSVFLPASAASAEVGHDWEHGRTALVLAAWAIIGIVICVRTFRWRRAE
jgi:ABC-2 type transport system permease protein